jgi:catechol 2,3-dioxygenase-like lactoylglutathione lyase family enzyme
MDGSGPTGALHHIEVWVPSLPRAIRSWGWLLGELGYTPFQEWSAGRSWRLGATYLVVEQSPDLVPGGPGHYAAYLENEDGFEVELVASDPA